MIETQAPLAFIDVETTGLRDDDEPWEIAVITRDPGYPDVVWHFQIEHDTSKAARLPDRFRADHDTRYDPTKAITRADAAEALHDILSSDGDHRTHLVGACPWFDSAHIGRILTAHGLTPSWHHHLIDIESMMLSRLARIGALIPWKSDDLSRRIGVEPPTTGRHTALADAKWARDIYDRLTARPTR